MKSKFIISLLIGLCIFPLHADQIYASQNEEGMLRLYLEYDGKILRPKEKPYFSCMNVSKRSGIRCNIELHSSGDGYLMKRPKPGRYRIHVEIDENRDNPPRFPGDYDVFFYFNLEDTTPEVHINIQKLMHLTHPSDNSRHIPGALRDCDKMLRYKTLSISQDSQAKIEFQWESLGEGVEYVTTIHKIQCSPFKYGPVVVSERSSEVRLSVSLAPNKPNEHYLFRVKGERKGSFIGEFFVFDGGNQAWDYRFIVENKSIPPAGTESKPEMDDFAKQSFINEWRSATPLPEWWESVEPLHYPVENYGDLIAVWSSPNLGNNYNLTENRRFSKSVYNAIIVHPEDSDLVTLGIHLFSRAIDDNKMKIGALEFALKRYADFLSRTDDCVNCNTGDDTLGLAHDLAEAYFKADRTDDAINILKRFLKTRGDDSNIYLKVEVYSYMSFLYWELKKYDDALEKIREAKDKYGPTRMTDQIIRKMERYEQELRERFFDSTLEVRNFHVMKKDETLRDLAWYYYGDADDYIKIVEFYRDTLSIPYEISVGQIIIIP